MTCTHYWNEGVLRIERGEPDAHVASCADCQRERERHEELARAIRGVSDGVTGAPDWQARVWAELAPAGPTRKRPWLLALGPAPIAAVMTVMVTSSPPPGDHVRVASSGGTRSAAAGVQMSAAGVQMSAVGDELEVSASPGKEIRIYHHERLVLRCVPGVETAGCTPGDGGLRARMRLALPGRYVVVHSALPGPAPTRVLDTDLAALSSSDIVHAKTEVDVW